MKTAVALLLSLLLGAPQAALAAQTASPPSQDTAAPGPTIRRFALIASANDGGPGRTRLRYADSDARAMAEVLKSLGGVRTDDLVLVPSATRSSLEQSFGRLRSHVAQAVSGPRAVSRQVIVYYSGHSDEEGLLLGNERVSYNDLRGWIDGAGADVRIAVLDSCASGALIRRKGGARVPAFLNDLSTDARGHAFLTASAASEAAQESDRIGAAFFTHYLVSGLRGAADVSRDGKVTLGEAYNFAYNETLRRTERTAAGPQHPAYDFQLAGSGEVVLTYLRDSSAVLVLDDKMAGRVFVRDNQGRLLVEMRKEPLYPVELGLEAGDYNVLLDADGRPFEKRVSLRQGQKTRLRSNEMQPVAALVAATRGDVAASVGNGTGVEAVVGASGSAPVGPYKHVPFELMLVPGVRTSGGGNARIHNNFVMGVLSHSHSVSGMQLSLGANVAVERMNGVQLAVGMNMVRGPGAGVAIASTNVAMDSFSGVQISDLVNVIKGQGRGLQLSIGNWVEGSFTGGQAGVLGYAKSGVRGAQLGVVTVARGKSRGVQASVVGLNENLRGLQLAVINVGGSVSGAQIGVVNIADKVDGLQLGVVNVGRSVSGASVGLLSFIGDGYHRASFWSSEVLATNIGFKLGSKRVYTLLAGGIGRHEDKALYGVQAGLGLHFEPTEKVFLDVDASTINFANESQWLSDDGTFSTLRMVVGWQLMRHLAVYAGPTMNVDARRVNATFRREGFGVLEQRYGGSKFEVRLFPGLVAGMQI